MALHGLGRAFLFRATLHSKMATGAIGDGGLAELLPTTCLAVIFYPGRLATKVFSERGQQNDGARAMTGDAGLEGRVLAQTGLPRRRAATVRIEAISCLTAYSTSGISIAGRCPMTIIYAVQKRGSKLAIISRSAKARPTITVSRLMKLLPGRFQAPIAGTNLARYS